MAAVASGQRQPCLATREPLERGAGSRERGCVTLDGFAEDERARPEQELLGALLLESRPPGERLASELDESGVGVCEPEDARGAVAGAVGVADRARARAA